MFMFDLEVDGLTDARGQAVAEACADAGAWPVSFVPGRVERRWFGIEKSYPPVIEIVTQDGTGSILAVTAERDAATIDFRHDAVPRLAATVRIIDEHFPEGFVFRATHSGSPIRVDEEPSLDELVATIQAGHLSEFTRYRVPGHPQAGDR